MKTLELTDINGTHKKEYVIISEISNWFGHSQPIYETFEEREPGGLFTKARMVSKIRHKETIEGSVIFLKNGKETYVFESPELIFNKLKNNETIEL